MNEDSSLKSVVLVCWSEKRFNDCLVLGILNHGILVADEKLLVVFGSKKTWFKPLKSSTCFRHASTTAGVAGRDRDRTRKTKTNSRTDWQAISDNALWPWLWQCRSLAGRFIYSGEKFLGPDSCFLLYVSYVRCNQEKIFFPTVYNLSVYVNFFFGPRDQSFPGPNNFAKNEFPMP